MPEVVSRDQCKRRAFHVSFRLAVLDATGARAARCRAAELKERIRKLDMLLADGGSQNLSFARELSQPWAAKLASTRLPKRSDRPRVSRSPEGLLVLQDHAHGTIRGSRGFVPDAQRPVTVAAGTTRDNRVVLRATRSMS